MAKRRVYTPKSPPKGGRAKAIWRLLDKHGLTPLTLGFQGKRWGIGTKAGHWSIFLPELGPWFVWITDGELRFYRDNYGFRTVDDIKGLRGVTLG